MVFSQVNLAQVMVLKMTVSSVRYRFITSLHSWCARFYGMYKGQANILIPNPRDLPAVMLAKLRKYQPSFFPAVNTLFNALVNNEEFKQLDHSKLKMAMGGGIVLPSTAEAWKK